MKEVEVIKAKGISISQNKGKTIERLRVAAYCRVSTDSEDQLNSYKSQVAYYTELIKKNREWAMAEIFADEAITGTQVTKREDFQRMINECMNGELLLVVLSSVAQQEVENISANVKKGLKMKMKRWELVGFQGCLGYDYHPEDKTITVNQEEAKIVQYIFNRYIEGAGGSVIGKELENLGYKTRYESSSWAQSTVIGIIKNEKYKGDLLMGKTFTVDPISKRRLDNFGEEDKFYIRDHHEAIISEETFEKAQAILKRRNQNRVKISDGNIKREKFSRQYAFSCMLECGFCGGTLTRRNWHGGTDHSKVVWQCVTATKKEKFCSDSKAIREKAIEDAFVEIYCLLCSDNKEVLEEFLQRMENNLNSSVNKQISKIDKEISTLEGKKNKLVDMRLEDSIDKATYESKYADFIANQENLIEDRNKLVETSENEKDIKRRLKEFKKTLEQNEVLDEFDRLKKILLTGKTG